jgi:hypothetical protein
MAVGSIPRCGVLDEQAVRARATSTDNPSFVISPLPALHGQCERSTDLSGCLVNKDIVSEDNGIADGEMEGGEGLVGMPDGDRQLCTRRSPYGASLMF